LYVKTQSNTPKLTTFQDARKFENPEGLAICHMTSRVVGKEEDWYDRNKGWQRGGEGKWYERM